ncbi:MAG: ABC transporter ATP-binding protein [Xanthobacteraceae bacterium]
MSKAASHLALVGMEDHAPTSAKERRERQAFITIRGLSKSFNEAVVYQNFDLDLPQGQIISIFGPNGCGKSTLINLISGLMKMDAGQVLFDGQTIQETRLSYVFQNYRDALFPWLRAIDNIHYPLKLMRMSRRRRDERLEKLLVDFDVKIDLHAYPYQLSGGQQQTVSILRALVTDPEVLFLDEPFSALDYEMTLFMREQLQRIFLKTRTTALLVSHDLEEAVQLANHVLLLTRRPTRVADFVEIDLPWPRATHSVTDARFVELKSHCLGVFEREIARQTSPTG